MSDPRLRIILQIDLQPLVDSFRRLAVEMDKWSRQAKWERTKFNADGIAEQTWRDL